MCPPYNPCLAAAQAAVLRTWCITRSQRQVWTGRQASLPSTALARARPAWPSAHLVHVISSLHSTLLFRAASQDTLTCQSHTTAHILPVAIYKNNSDDRLLAELLKKSDTENVSVSFPQTHILYTMPESFFQNVLGLNKHCKMEVAV